jgi:hypothetical protein
MDLIDPLRLRAASETASQIRRTDVEYQARWRTQRSRTRLVHLPELWPVKLSLLAVLSSDGQNRLVLAGAAAEHVHCGALGDGVEGREV